MTSPTRSASGHRQHPAAAPATHHEVRFRSRTQDGRETISTSLKVRPSHPQPSAGSLAHASFGHQRYRPGDEAELSVSAHGLEGETVRFLLEKQEGGSWSALDEVRAVVRAGVARGRWRVPADGAAQALRFRALCHFAAAAAAPASVAPSPAGALHTPEWSHGASAGSQFEHGDDASMRVHATGCEGRRVRFLVEYQSDGAWKPYATVRALVHAGVAVARFQVLHPRFPRGKRGTRAELRAARPMQLRFHAELE